VKSQLLVRILEDQKYRLWSRIAAAYVLGFLQYSGQSPTVVALLRITEDTRERVSLRAHAVEALSNLGAVEAIPQLEKISRNKDESKRLQKWCIFALSELKSDGRSS
jgi:HEAT repeat protein